jgi:hypothetical protein
VGKTVGGAAPGVAAAGEAALLGSGVGGARRVRGTSACGGAVRAGVAV